MGMPKATSYSRSGYDGHTVFPLSLRQQTSHVQQDHPHLDGVLNSFVLPVRRWVPLLLQYGVLPPGVIQMRLTGSAFVVDSAFLQSGTNEWRTFPQMQFGGCLRGLLFLWSDNVRT